MMDASKRLRKRGRRSGDQAESGLGHVLVISDVRVDSPLTGQWTNTEMTKPHDVAVMLERDMAVLGTGKAW